MGITAMAVGGTFGILAKGTVNRLMKVSLRRGEQQIAGQRTTRALEVDHLKGFLVNSTRRLLPLGG